MEIGTRTPAADDEKLLSFIENSLNHVPRALFKAEDVIEVSFTKFYIAKIGVNWHKTWTPPPG